MELPIEFLTESDNGIASHMRGLAVNFYADDIAREQPCKREPKRQGLAGQQE
jgi:hypothetical protein